MPRGWAGHRSEPTHSRDYLTAAPEPGAWPGLDGGAPFHGDQTVARAVLFHVAGGGEVEVVAGDQHLLGCRHVVEAVTGLLGEFRVVIVHHVPVRVAQEEFR